MVEGYRDLVEKCLEDSATPDEIQRVVDAAAADPACAALLDEASVLDACLRASARDPGPFVKRFMPRITHGKDRKAFATQTVERLRREWDVVESPGPRPVHAAPRAGRRARVRRPLGSRRLRRHTAVYFAAAAAAILAVYLGGAFDGRAHAPRAEVVRMQGQAEILRSGTAEAMSVGALLGPGTQLRTGAAGRVELRYADGTQLALAENSSMALVERADAKRVSVFEGVLTADVVPQLPGTPMVVVTENAEATVFGTRFTIIRDGWFVPVGATRLEVETGMVALSDTNGVSVDVRAGEYALAGQGLRPAARPMVLDLAGYRVTFDEEFEDLSVSGWGPCGPGGTRWMAHAPYAGDFGEAGFTDPEERFPFTIAQGVLRIEARKGKAGRWRSGLLASVDPKGNGFSQSRGYFECRMKLPGGPGTWPAFWLKSASDVSTKAPEVAGCQFVVINHYGGEPDVMHTEWQTWRAGSDTGRAIVRHRVNGLTDDFHTFGCLVAPDTISWYVDRRELWSVPAHEAADRPLYPLVDLALGGGWPVDNTPNPSHLFVDYIKVYAREQ